MNKSTFSYSFSSLLLPSLQLRSLRLLIPCQGEVVGKVADLGAYSLQKADDEESPVTRDEYKRRYRNIQLTFVFYLLSCNFTR
jgi:hypothetical protein